VEKYMSSGALMGLQGCVDAVWESLLFWAEPDFFPLEPNGRPVRVLNIPLSAK